MKKKDEKTVEVISTKVEMVTLFKTTYHRYRHWIRTILIEGKVNQFSFKKDKVGYTGLIVVNKAEVEKAKKVLSEYKAKNSDTIDMWW
jgi:hypothetical protein